MKIYLDNAATTPLDKEVFKTMEPYFLEHFGNPSSSHRQGREVRHAIENSRDQIATLSLSCCPPEHDRQQFAAV